MESFAAGLANRGVAVYRFEFPYMRQITETGRRRPPNPLAVLEAAWRAVIDELAPLRLVIGGKSMGGRVASLIAGDGRFRLFSGQPAGRSGRTGIWLESPAGKHYPGTGRDAGGHLCAAPCLDSMGAGDAAWAISEPARSPIPKSGHALPYGSCLSVATDIPGRTQPRTEWPTETAAVPAKG